MVPNFEYPPGASVKIGDDIIGKVEELIFVHGQTKPMLLVEYWLDGRLGSARVHLEDVQALDGGTS